MERDDLRVNDQYALDAHHDEEHGKQVRKRIIFVTVLLSVVTAVEVLLGVFVKRSNVEVWPYVKWAFVVLTLVKAGYIVMTFMHLGDEKRNLRSFILIPYMLFILYLIFILLVEGDFINTILSSF